MDNSIQPPIKLCSLTVGYRNRTLINNADTAFTKGDFTAIIGRNGTGKSTLMRTIAGLCRPIEGHIEINGKDIRTLSRNRIAAQISLVSTEEIRIADLKVMDVVSLGRAPYTNWMGRISIRDKHLINQALTLVGMSGFAEKNIANLSDGERQRVMIARALAQDTEIILLDEPTAFLDLPNKYEICLLLKRLAHQQKKCIITSTHDLDIALELCDSIAIIDNNMLTNQPKDKFLKTGLIERLFDNTQLTFDRTTGTIKLKQQDE